MSDSCKGYEYTYSSEEVGVCNMKSSGDINDCDEKNSNTDFFLKEVNNEPLSLPSHYMRFQKSCIDGADIYEISGSDIFGCADMCQLNQACLGFEYYVNYGGPQERTYGNCMLKSSRDMANCDGVYGNTDLYIQEEPHNSLIGEQYFGCYKDKPARDLEYSFSNDIAPKECFELISAAGYKYAGLQNSSECWGGNNVGTYGERPDDQCDMLCTRDSSRVCGGNWRNSVFAMPVHGHEAWRNSVFAMPVKNQTASSIEAPPKFPLVSDDRRRQDPLRESNNNSNTSGDRYSDYVRPVTAISISTTTETDNYLNRYGPLRGNRDNGEIQYDIGRGPSAVSESTIALDSSTFFSGKDSKSINNKHIYI
jgi:hypothetical protein